MGYRIQQVHTAVGRFAPAEAEVVRVLAPDHEPCLVMASAGACGWSLCDGKSSRNLLDAFEFCWNAWTRPVRPAWRLHCAVLGAIRQHGGGLPAYVPEDPDLLGPPWGYFGSRTLQGGDRSLRLGWRRGNLLLGRDRTSMVQSSSLKQVYPR